MKRRGFKRRGFKGRSSRRNFRKRSKTYTVSRGGIRW